MKRYKIRWTDAGLKMFW